jgi:hypothetical protein
LPLLLAAANPVHSYSGAAGIEYRTHVYIHATSFLIQVLKSQCQFTLASRGANPFRIMYAPKLELDNQNISHYGRQ